MSHFEVPAELASIGVIQSRVEELAEPVLDPGSLFKLSMAIEEVVTNIVAHGHTDGTMIGVSISIADGQATVEIEDHGVAFDPFHDAPRPHTDAALEDRAVGGLGIHLVREMMSETSYRRLADRNHIRLVMRRKSDSGQETGS